MKAPTDILEYAAEKEAEKDMAALLANYPALCAHAKEINPYIRVALLLALIIKTVENECDMLSEESITESLHTNWEYYRKHKGEKDGERHDR